MNLGNIFAILVFLFNISNNAAENKALKYDVEYLKTLDKETRSAFNNLKKVLNWVGGIPWVARPLVTQMGIIQEEIDAIPLFKMASLSSTEADFDDWISKQTDEAVTKLLSEADKSSTLKELINVQNKKLEDPTTKELAVLTKEDAFGRLFQSTHFKKTRCS